MPVASRKLATIPSHTSILAIQAVGAMPLPCRSNARIPNYRRPYHSACHLALWLWLCWVILGAGTAMSADSPTAIRLALDLRDPAVVHEWTSVDDRVMGGVSASRIVATPEGLEFSGAVSLANNGGFASIRARPRAYDLAGTTALLLRVRGDGQTYKLALRTDEAFDGVQYQARFATRAGEWIEVVMPMTDFQPTFRGRQVEAPALDPGRIRGFGLLIADRQAGPFRLVVESIRARF